MEPPSCIEDDRHTQNCFRALNNTLTRLRRHSSFDTALGESKLSTLDVVWRRAAARHVKPVALLDPARSLTSLDAGVVKTAVKPEAGDDASHRIRHPGDPPARATSASRSLPQASSSSTTGYPWQELAQRSAIFRALVRNCELSLLHPRDSTDPPPRAEDDPEVRAAILAEVMERDAVGRGAEEPPARKNRAEAPRPSVALSDATLPATAQRVEAISLDEVADEPAAAADAELSFLLAPTPAADAARTLTVMAVSRPPASVRGQRGDSLLPRPPAIGPGIVRTADGMEFPFARARMNLS